MSSADWAEVRSWCVQWKVPDLADRLEIRASARLRTSLARCRPDRAEVRIAPFVLEGPPDLRREVLCHETAHAAVAVLHGKDVRPHGREWKALMRRAGFQPRVRIDGREIDRLSPDPRRQRVVWVHRCPVCQAERRAGRPVRAWRCAGCREAGLEGRLRIWREPRLGSAPR